MTAVLGFIAQCDVCPQKAIVSEQPSSGWVCPRCAEVTEPSPYVDPQYVYTAPGSFTLPDDEDDGPDLRKVQG
jgi:hypothetical protein